MGKLEILQKDAKTDRTTDPVPLKTSKGQLIPLHDPAASMTIVNENIYAKRCIDEIYKTTVGKGFEKISDAWKRILTQDLLERIDKDYLKVGNAYIEVKTLSGKIVAMYHVPALTIAKFVKDGKYYYKQPGVKGGSEFPPYSSFTGTETGSYILHLMDYEDDEHYGSPFWLGAEKKITQTTYADTYNSNFFQNDCRPGSVILAKNLNLSEPEEIAFKTFLKNGFRGVANSRKTILLSAPVDGDLEIKGLAESVIDMSFINMIRDNKTDICAAFRVPPKLVGLETPGRLGGGNDFAVQTNIFYENEIIPRQVYYEEIFSGMSGEEIKFIRPKMMEISSQALPPEPAPQEIQKEANSELTAILKIIADKL
jgi:hypothetical protein